MRYKTILTIAGSDSSGGAGIQADIKTATLLGCYAMSVVTAVTAQNSQGVKGFESVSEKILEMQLDAILSDVKPDAVKIGMVPSPEAASIIGRMLHKYEVKNVVYDPVMVSTSGKELCGDESDFIKAIKCDLLPVTTILTPNIPEARALIANTKDSLGELILEMGPDAVLIKGGHLESEDEAVDTLYMKPDKSAEMQVRTHTFKSQRIETSNLHGTGCVLSTAIACGLAKNLDMPEAVSEAKQFINNAILIGKDYSFGKNGGYGPLYLVSNQLINNK